MRSWRRCRRGCRKKLRALSPAFRRYLKELLESRDANRRGRAEENSRPRHERRRRFRRGRPASGGRPRGGGSDHVSRRRPGGGGRAKCCGPREIEDAGKICRELGIRHYVVDFTADLEENIVAIRCGVSPGKDAQPLRRLQPGDQVRFAPEEGAGLGVRRPRHGTLCPYRKRRRSLSSQNAEGPAEGSDLFPPRDLAGISGDPFSAGRVHEG